MSLFFAGAGVLVPFLERRKNGTQKRRRLRKIIDWQSRRATGKNVNSTPKYTESQTNILPGPPPAGIATHGR